MAISPDEQELRSNVRTALLEAIQTAAEKTVKNMGTYEQVQSEELNKLAQAYALVTGERSGKAAGF
jgi:hypothetical protein